MANKIKFRKGQTLVCTHYKDKPVVKVDELINVSGVEEVWVKETSGKIWWGPTDWFKVVRKTKKQQWVIGCAYHNSAFSKHNGICKYCGRK